MMKHGLRLGMAVLLGTGMAGVAFAQGATTSTMQPTPRQPAVGTQAPPAPANHALTPPTGTNAAVPNTAATNTATPNTAPSNTPAANTEMGNATAVPHVSMKTIKEAQSQLKSEGLYKGAIDGRVGPETRAAVRQFQQKNGLNATAMLDQQTLQRLMHNQSHG